MSAGRKTVDRICNFMTNLVQSGVGSRAETREGCHDELEGGEKDLVVSLDDRRQERVEIYVDGR